MYVDSNEQNKQTNEAETNSEMESGLVDVKGGEVEGLGEKERGLRSTVGRYRIVPGTRSTAQAAWPTTL